VDGAETLGQDDAALARTLVLLPGRARQESPVIILGVILLVLGAVFNVSILYVIGGILVVVGAVLWILGSMNRAVGPRKHYF